MNMKNRIIEYIEAQELSKVCIAKNLHMNLDKFERGNQVDWSAEELLQICVYIQVDPEQFYESQLYRTGKDYTSTHCIGGNIEQSIVYESHGQE